MKYEKGFLLLFRDDDNDNALAIKDDKERSMKVVINLPVAAERTHMKKGKKRGCRQMQRLSVNLITQEKEVIMPEINCFDAHTALERSKPVCQESVEMHPELKYEKVLLTYS